MFGIKQKSQQRKQQKSDEELMRLAYDRFEEFRTAYASEWARLDHNEYMYRGDHWHDIEETDPNEPRPVTPVIQSTIENITADLMDNFPEAIIMPESPEDETVASVVNEIIRQNHDAANYEREWWKLSHDLLVGGYMVQEIGYDHLLNNNLGGAFIRHIDAASVMFDPLCTDIQDGRAVIKYTVKPIKWLEQHYPEHAGQLTADHYSFVSMKDTVLTQDDTKSALMIEYWWREFEDNRYKVHVVKVAGNKLLEDSRTQKPDGMYSHGKYPFVITPLFIRKGSALGYGIVDMFENQQMYSDKLDQIVLKNAIMASKNKMLVTTASGFDEDDLKDWAKEVHVGENLNGITWFPTPPLPPYIIAYIQQMRQDIKDESGANDFSRGTTNSGVTAASAIAALQEVSAKRSRMAARQMHDAYKDAVRMEIEVEREYNILPRPVYLTKDGQKEKQTFASAIMQRKTELGNVVPIEFMVSIKVQRQNRWSIAAHNELMLQMVQLGVVQPDQAVELMQFEGRETVLKKKTEQVSPEEVQQKIMLEDAKGLPTPEQITA
jgi:hypothetical protein